MVRFGVIAEPEVTGWQTLDANDRFLVVSSDGIFESMTPQDVCDLVHDSSSCSPSSSLAKCLVNTAFEKGSVDNLSVIVVPWKVGGYALVFENYQERAESFM